MFNVEAFRDTLEKLMRDNAEFMYVAEACEDTCAYVHVNGSDNPEDWTPGCLIGQALHANGVPLEYLRQVERHRASSVLETLGVFDSDTLEYADRLQNNQDIGIAWGRLNQAIEGEYGA